jgi:hypothetical protein
MTELKQTVGSVRIEGKVVGFDLNDEKTYRKGETREKKNKYHSISLIIKTATNNVIYNVDLFGQIPDKKVKIYSNKDGVKQKVEIDYTERANFPDGFTCFGFGSTSITLEKDAEGKVRKHNYFDYEAVQIIKDNIKDGDSVWVDAEFKVETYTNSEGDTKSSVKYKITNIGLLKDIDLESADYKEVSYFEHDVVILSTNINKEKKKLYIAGRIIDFFGNFSDMTFTVDGNKHLELVDNIVKKTKFGDVISVQGKIVNGTVLIEAPVVLDWGGESPEGAGKMNKDRISELQITKVTKHVAKVYRQEDFVKVESFGASDTPFPSAPQASSSNPFED